MVSMVIFHRRSRKIVVVHSGVSKSIGGSCTVPIGSVRGITSTFFNETNSASSVKMLKIDRPFLPRSPLRSQYEADRPDKAPFGTVRQSWDAFAATCNTIQPFLTHGGLTVDSFKSRIKAMQEEHANNVAGGDYVSGDREGEGNELQSILERLRAGDVLRREQDTAVKEGRLLDDAKKAARATKVR